MVRQSSVLVKFLVHESALRPNLFVEKFADEIEADGDGAGE